MVKRMRNDLMPNVLLANLPPALAADLLSAGDVVPLKVKAILHEPDEATPYVYFPLSGVISLLTVLDDGSAVEIATVGNEGMVDIAAFLDLASPARWLVQVPGLAVRIATEEVHRRAEVSPMLRNVMHSYMLAMFVLVSQTAACNRRHPVEERCARWLLMTHDRVDDDSFPMTHEFLADMLGVRRPSVSIAMKILSTAGYMRYRRGKVEIIDRAGLEEASCECYAVLSRRFETRFS